MAQPTNTQSTYKAVGNREQLSDIISEISPDTIKFTKNIGKGDAKGKYVEWQQYTLTAAEDDNTVIEADVITNNAPEERVRVGNYTQLSDKAAEVSTSQEEVETAGVASEMDFEVTRKTRSLMTSVEKQMLSNKPSRAGSDNLGRQSGGFEAWIETNENRGTSGASGGFNSGTVEAPTDGTQRPFTEAMLKDVMKQRAEAGNDENGMVALYMGAHVKTVASGFTGIADQRRETRDRPVKIIGAADFYLSDFGEIGFIYSQFVRPRTALFVDHDKVSQLMLQDYHSFDLAKLAHTHRKAVAVEYTLRVENEAAHGVAADLAIA